MKEKEAHFRHLQDVANLGSLTPQERAVYDENLKNPRARPAPPQSNLRKAGVDSFVIAQSTGLSLEEVNDLENLIREEEIKS